MKHLRLLCLASALLPAMLWADPAEHIPAAADAAVYIRVAKLKAHPALKRLADSGELSRFERSLRSLDVSPEAYAVAFFGIDERVVLADAPARDVLLAALKNKYLNQRNKKENKIDESSIEGYPAVTRFYYRPSEKTYHSYYEALWLTPGCAAFGDEDYPLPRKKLVPAATGAFRELSAAGTLAAAYIPDPSCFGFDVMGLASQLCKVRLTAAQVGDGMVFSGYAEARNPKTLPQTSQLFNGAMRILLVTFFGDDEALCQSLLQKVRISASENALEFGMELDAAALIAIQNYYDTHAERLLKTLKNNVQKTK